MTAPEIPNFHRLQRSKLRALLSKDLDIRRNKRLSNIVFEPGGETVTAVFEDGEYIDGRLIIRADSTRSSVRKILLGPDISPPTRLSYSATFLQSKYTREQALFLRSLNPPYITAPHPDGYLAFFGLQDAPEADKPEDWKFFFCISWNSSFEQQNEERETFGDKKRLAQVKEKSKLDNRSGRVTLVGDAAHPMTYQRGQGLNHSTTDAGKLVDFFTSQRLSQLSAVEKYEEEMVARAGGEVRSSVMNATMLRDWAKVLESAVMKTSLSKK